MSMRISSAAALVGALALAAHAQEAAKPAEDLQAKCYEGRYELEQLLAKTADLTKKGIIAETLEEIMEIEEDSDWRACLHEIEATLKAVE